MGNPQGGSGYRSGRDLARCGDLAASAREADFRLADIDGLLGKVRGEVEKLRQALDSIQTGGTGGTTTPVIPSAPTLVDHPGSPTPADHWLQENHPEQDAVGAIIYPHVRIRIILPAGIRLEDSAHSVVCGCYASNEVYGTTHITPIRTDANAHGFTSPAISLTSQDVARGYVDWIIPSTELVIGQKCSALIVAMAASGGYAETVYGLTDRVLYAGEGLDLPETPSIVAEHVTKDHTKFKLTITYPYQAPPPPYVNCCNFYDKLLVFECADPLAAGQTPDSAPSLDWEESVSVGLQGLIKKIKGGGKNYKNFTIKHKRGQTYYLAAQILNTDGQVGAWLAFSTTGTDPIPNVPTITAVSSSINDVPGTTAVDYDVHVTAGWTYGLGVTFDEVFEQRLQVRAVKEFATGKLYRIGALVRYSGANYTCNTQHTASSWVPGYWTSTPNAWYQGGENCDDPVADPPTGAATATVPKTFKKGQPVIIQARARCGTSYSAWSADYPYTVGTAVGSAPQPLIDAVGVVGKNTVVTVTIQDSPVGSRTNAGNLQVFRYTGSSDPPTTDPDSDPSHWIKAGHMDVADEIARGIYTVELAVGGQNKAKKWYIARTKHKDDATIASAWSPGSNGSESNNVATVTAPTSANFVGMAIDDDSQTNKTEMTFDLQLFFDALNLANKTHIDVYVKKSLDGGATYTKMLQIGTAELAAGDTSCIVNFYRQVKKGQWVKLVKTIVRNEDAVREQAWNVVCQITKQPLAISSASVSPTTGQTTSQNFTFSVVATGGTAPYGYLWTFDSAVTYVSGNQNSQSPVVRFGSQGAHWGKCTVTDSSTPQQSVVTNQLVCTIVQGGGSLSVNLIPSATSGTSPLSIVLNAYATGGTGVYTWYTFTWDTSQQGSASSSANATLRNVEGLVTGQSKAITCMCKVEDSAGNTGIGICIVTVAPPIVQRWAMAAFDDWQAVVQGGNGSAWTSSSGTSDLSAAIDANGTTYVKTSIPAGESSQYLWVYGLDHLAALPANAIILGLIGQAVVGPYDSGETGLTQNMETKWMRFTKNSLDMTGMKYGMGDEWDVQTYQGLYYPWESYQLGGSFRPFDDPTQRGVWQLSDVNTEQYIGIKLKVHNAGSVTKVARVYGFKLYILYYLN